MTDNNPHINYSFADIERYLNGGMTAKEMHAMERAALQDPFLADAIDGYRNADRDIADKHLNGIAAALQKEQPAKVIAMPGKKSYNWLIAASLAAVIGVSVFLLMPRNNESEPLAKNSVGQALQPDSFSDNKKEIAPQSDSEPTSLPELANAKAATEKKKRTTSARKEKSLATSEETQDVEQVQPSPAQASGDVAMAYSAPTPMDKAISKPQQAPVRQDTVVSATLAQANVALAARQQAKAKSANIWTTGSGKPFHFSDVEVVSIGKKDRKRIDTTAVKPEGGWQSFQEYLFSRLSHRDSLEFVNSSTITDNLELEFSIDKSGSPYDITVLHTQDTTLTNKIVTAVQSGPKWTSSDKKEKRLRLRY